MKKNRLWFLKRITFFDILSAVLIFTVTLSFIFFHYFTQQKGALLIIKAPSGEYFYLLDQKKTVQIQGENGLTTIQIDYGKFHFLDSACPNKLCVNQGWISIANFPVVCLPNKVTAYIGTKKSSRQEYDGVSW